jgi:hypothetical protein
MNSIKKFLLMLSIVLGFQVTPIYSADPIALGLALVVLIEFPHLFSPAPARPVTNHHVLSENANFGSPQELQAPVLAQAKVEISTSVQNNSTSRVERTAPRFKYRQGQIGRPAPYSIQTRSAGRRTLTSQSGKK